MTSDDHLARTEELLGYAANIPDEERGTQRETSFLLEALVHAVAAISAPPADAQATVRRLR